MACHCLFLHATTPEEVERVREILMSSREIGDSVGVMIALARLRPCPSMGDKSMGDKDGRP